MADSAEKKTQTEEKKLLTDAINPAATTRRALMESIALQGPRASKGPPLGFRGPEVLPGNQFEIQFAAYRRTVQDDLDAMEARSKKDLREFQADIYGKLDSILDTLTAKFDATATSMGSLIGSSLPAMPPCSNWYTPPSVTAQAKPSPFSIARTVPKTPTVTPSSSPASAVAGAMPIIIVDTSFSLMNSRSSTEIWNLVCNCYGRERHTIT